MFCASYDFRNDPGSLMSTQKAMIECLHRRNESDELGGAMRACRGDVTLGSHARDVTPAVGLRARAAQNY